MELFLFRIQIIQFIFINCSQIKPLNFKRLDQLLMKIFQFRLFKNI